MKRKLSLMFAMLMTLAFVWVSTTGAAWASPASGTVPPGSGPYRLFVATSNTIAGHATYSLFAPTGKVPAGMRFLLQGAAVLTYNYKWQPASVNVVICGLIPPTRKGQLYKRSGTGATIKWTALPSSTSGTNPKMICALSNSGKFVVIGK